MGKVKRRMLFITLTIGAMPTAISFINGNWWLGTAFMLLTLLVDFHSSPPRLHALAQIRASGQAAYDGLREDRDTRRGPDKIRKQLDARVRDC